MHRTILAFLALCSSALAQDAQLVEVSPVRYESVEISRPLVATLDAVMRTSVAAEVDGRVASRSFDDGQLIKANAELMSLDTELMQADLAAANATVSAAEAELNRANVELKRTERELKRQTDLFEKNVSPEKELLDARSSFEGAAADIQTKEAAVAQRKALRDRIAAEIRKSRVFAPFDAHVARRRVEVGQWVKQGDVVADLVQLDPLYVIVAVPDTIAGQIVAGDRATITLDALPGQQLEAPVTHVMPEADMASRMVRMQLTLDNKAMKLRPGFLARVVFKKQSGESLVVPKNAVVTSGQGSHVVVSRENVAAIVPVTVLKSNAADAVIQADLKAGDLVVTRGNETLFPGASLQFTPPATQPSTGGANP
jgi:membrane fusion protein (multidrug efflux system)